MNKKFLTLITLLVICSLNVYAQGRFTPPPPNIEDQLDEARDLLNTRCGNVSAVTNFKLAPPGRPLEDLIALAAANDETGGAKQTKQNKQTTAEWAAYTQQELIQAIAVSGYNDMRPLFYFDSNVEAVMSQANLLAVANNLTALVANYASNLNAIRAHLLYIQIAYYHDWYQSSIDYDAATDIIVRSAMGAVGSSPAFLTTAPFYDSIRAQWAVSIDNADATVYMLPTVQALLERFAATPAIQAAWEERDAVYSVLYSLQRQIGNNAAFGMNSPWYNEITAQFAASIAAIATDTNYYPPTEYIVNNAVWTLGQLSKLNASTALLGKQYLSDAYATFSHTSGPWIWAVQAIDTFYGGMLFNGGMIDTAAIRAELNTLLFPNTFVFDNGALTFRTALGRGKIALLYDALQEVEAQFFRLTRNLTAVPGDQNPTLEAFIYASPSEYANYQTFLYGTSTANGGIYIEQAGQFYTYDRTGSQSSYTLEELFRHEYVHYLDGRYQVQGEFGDPGIYDNSRITWYQEGFAELCAGSTRLQGVLTRGKLVDNVSYDGSNRLTVAETVGASYNSGFKFYNYSALLLNYLLDEDPFTLMDLLSRIRANNTANIDSLWATLQGDATLQTNFDLYLDELIDQRSNGGRTFKESVPTDRTPKYLPSNNATALANAIASVGAADFPSWETIDNRFIYSAFLTLPIGQTASSVPHLVRQAFVLQLDARLAALLDEADNFKSATAWFGGVTTNGTDATASILIETPYCFDGCAPKVWYVDKANAGNPSQDGNTWASAFSDIQPAIDAAYQGGDEVWVAVGVYSENRSYEPEGLGANAGSLLVRDGVSLYGGFLGSMNNTFETSRDQRILWQAQPVISGATSRDGSPAYHVAVMQESTVLDNFIISGGVADGSEDREESGGGIYMSGVTNGVIVNCFVSDNHAGYAGAGIYAEFSSPTIHNCYVNNNYNDSYGGGIYLYYGLADIKNCIIWNNYAYSGGGLYCYAGSDADVSNIVLYGNTAAYGALAVTGGAEPVIRNSIVWNTGVNADMLVEYGGNPTISYSDIRGTYDGTGNIDADPMFINANGGDFQIAAASPCRDTGTNLGAPATDIFGNVRPMDQVVDMGAREYPGQLPEPEGEPPIDDGWLTCDINQDYVITLTELLRVIQFYNTGSFHCETGTEDGYAPGLGLDYTCEPYDLDYNIQDWRITLIELLRAIQFYNSLAYHFCPAEMTEDGFCPGP